MIQLTANGGGNLYLGDKLILYVYPAGDCDRIRWPLVSPEDRGKLAGALYDAREMGDIPGSESAVLLPDGERFEIEANLGLYEPPSMEGYWY